MTDTKERIALLFRKGTLKALIFINYGQPSYFEEMKAVSEWSQARGYTVDVVDADIEGVEECMAIGPTEDGLRILPGRNMVMCSHAANVAVAKGCSTVWYGANKDDKDYPDCNPHFISAMNHCLRACMISVEIEAPLVQMNKKQIIKEAVSLNMELDKAWSCYESVKLNEPCGLCHSCKERIDAGG